MTARAAHLDAYLRAQVAAGAQPAAVAARRFDAVRAGELYAFTDGGMTVALHERTDALRAAMAGAAAA